MLQPSSDLAADVKRITNVDGMMGVAVLRSSDNHCLASSNFALKDEQANGRYSPILAAFLYVLHFLFPCAFLWYGV